uniref:C-X-C motif chemokine n=1 Tax=Ficedula albicollis TaxID=59894 RepID=U3K0A5_FICAL
SSGRCSATLPSLPNLKEPLSRAPLAGELRCRCVRTVSEVIPPRRLARLELLAEGPHCAVPEVIATTKQGQMVCLDPAAPWVKYCLMKSQILPLKSFAPIQNLEVFNNFYEIVGVRAMSGLVFNQIMLRLVSWFVYK